MSVVISSGELHHVSSGTTDDNDFVLSNGGEVISNGGTSEYTHVTNGGFLIVDSGGNAVDTDVQSGGTALIESGGLETITDGDTETVAGTLTVSGSVDIASGGELIDSGLVVLSSGVAVSGGGELVVVSGGVLEALSGSNNSNLLSFRFSGGSLVWGESPERVNDPLGYGNAILDLTIVSGGGEAYETKVMSGGILTVSSGGVAANATVYSGGTVEVLSGGQLTGTTLSGGTEISYVDWTVTAGATQNIGPGLYQNYGTITLTTATGTTGGALEDEAALVNYNNIIIDGGPGGFVYNYSNGYTIIPGAPGATFSVAAGAALINSGSIEIDGGGPAGSFGPTGGMGGTLIVSSGSSIDNKGTISVEGAQFDDSGDSGTGGAIEIQTGASLTNDGTIALLPNPSPGNAGRSQDVVGPGGGQLYIESGGSLTNNGTITLDGPDPDQYTGAEGGTGALIVVESDATLTNSGSIVVGAGDYNQPGSITISAGGQLTNFGTVTLLQLVDPGHEQSAKLSIESGGTFTNAGTLVVSATADVIDSGTFVGTSNSQLTIGGSFIVESGGSLIESGSIVNDGSLTISAGGTLGLFGSATTSGSPIKFLGGAEVIGGGYQVSGLKVDGTAISNLTISSGGVARDLTLTGSGGASVLAGGSTISALIQSGAEELVYAQGTASASQLKGGQLDIFKGGVATSTTIFNSGLLVVSSGGFSRDTMIQGGGRLVVLSGGTDGADAGGQEHILNGGSETVSAGGSLQIVGGAGFIVGQGGQSGGLLVIEGQLTNSGSAVVGSGGSLGSGAIAQVRNGGSLINDGTLTIQGGSAGATFDISRGGTVTDSGSMTVQSGGTVIDSGQLTVASGGSLSNAGTLVISGGTLDIQSGAVVSGAITFAGAGGILQVDANTPPAGVTIDGFAAGDSIDLTSLAYNGDWTVTRDDNNDVSINEGGKTYELQFDPQQDLSGVTFNVTNLNGTTLTEETVPCYCRGTSVLTERGPVAVENLLIGDRIVTRNAGLKPIKWIGTRSYRGRFVVGRKDILPVCLKAGSLEDGVPRRDLWVSPHHAMYIDGVLIEARNLLNGVSIVQVEDVEMVEYFHVELDTHDVIFAEGALSETFVDDDNRGMFQNALEFAALFPDSVSPPARYCAPRVDTGYVVEAVRRRLALHAGIDKNEQGSAAGELTGFIDRIDAGLIEGWAQNTDYPEAPVCLDIYADGQLLGQTLANCYREDLRAAGVGNGRYGFTFRVNGEIGSTAGVEVRRSIDGAKLASQFQKFGTNGQLKQNCMRPRERRLHQR